MDEATTGPDSNGVRLLPLEFSDLPGWRRDDHGAAFAAFRRSAAGRKTSPPRQRAIGFDAAALAVTRTPDQVVDILRYVIKGELAGYTDQAAAAE